VVVVVRQRCPTMDISELRLEIVSHRVVVNAVVVVVVVAVVAAGAVAAGVVVVVPLMIHVLVAL